MVSGPAVCTGRGCHPSDVAMCTPSLVQIAQDLAALVALLGVSNLQCWMQLRATA